MLKLPDSVSSLQDLSALEVEIHGYAKWLAHEAIKKRVEANNASEAPSLTPAAVECLRTAGNGKTATTASLDSLIQQLENYKSTARSITITLAAPPTKGLKATLVTWCRSNIGPDVLVTFSFNSTLLGGMVVRSGSHVYDWSFRRQILDARSAFPEVLRNVR